MGKRRSIRFFNRCWDLVLGFDQSQLENRVKTGVAIINRSFEELPCLSSSPPPSEPSQSQQAKG